MNFLTRRDCIPGEQQQHMWEEGEVKEGVPSAFLQSNDSGRAIIPLPHSWTPHFLNYLHPVFISQASAVALWNVLLLDN